MPPKRPLQTPDALGYRMPAEWEPHEATILAWPHDPVSFPDRVDRVEAVYMEMIKALTPHERVELVVRDAPMCDRVKDWLLDEDVANVRMHVLDHADVWARDWAPTFLVGPDGLGAVKWRFNAWGDKYDTLLKDDRTGKLLLQAFDGDAWDVPWVLEGGSIEVNGAGTVLTTEQCLLNPNRNPDFNRSDIERRLKQFLGVRHVLWLGDGVEGDDTDGHIDDLTRFVGPRTVVTAMEPDTKDLNHAVLAENRKRLAAMTDQDGAPLDVIELPMPPHVGDDEGRLPASHANFYIANEIVLVPVFGGASDDEALRILGKAMPERRMVPIDCSDLVYGMGTVHCVTQQVPRAGGA